MIIDQLPLIGDIQGTDELPIERGTLTYKARIQDVQGTVTPKMDGTAAVGSSVKYAREDHVHPTDANLEKAVLQPSSYFPIPSGSVTISMNGITEDHVLVRWNFTASAENAPPCSLSWSTANGSFTITKTSGTTSEGIQPVFVLPKKVNAS